MHQEATTTQDRADPLDWVLERAIARVRGTRGWSDEPRPPVPPRRQPRAQRATVAGTELGDWVKALCGPSWSNREVLEIVDSEPILPGALGKESVKRYVAILADKFDGRRWAARFPRFQFLIGSVDDALARVGGGFDRAVITSCMDSPMDTRLEGVVAVVERRGIVVVRVGADSSAAWPAWQAALHRFRLRILRKETLADRTSILMTQRK